jgi:hypothetical protein
VRDNNCTLRVSVRQVPQARPSNKRKAEYPANRTGPCKCFKEM